MEKTGFKENIITKVRKAKGHYDNKDALQQALIKMSWEI